MVCRPDPLLQLFLDRLQLVQVHFFKVLCRLARVQYPAHSCQVPHLFKGVLRVNASLTLQVVLLAQTLSEGSEAGETFSQTSYLLLQVFDLTQGCAARARIAFLQLFRPSTFWAESWARALQLQSGRFKQRVFFTQLGLQLTFFK